MMGINYLRHLFWFLLIFASANIFASPDIYLTKQDTTVEFFSFSNDVSVAENVVYTHLLDNQSGDKSFYFSAGHWKYVDITIVSPLGRRREYRAGWLVRNSKTAFKYGFATHREVLEKIDLYPGLNDITIALKGKVNNEFNKSYSNKLYTEQFVLESNHSQFMDELPFILILLSFVLYNFILYYLLKDQGFLIYIAKLIGFTLSWINAYSFLSFQIDVLPIYFIEFDVWISFIVLISNIYFIQMYLSTKKNDRLIHLVFTTLFYASVAGLLMSIIGSLFRWEFLIHLSVDLCNKIIPGPLMIVITVALYRAFKKMPGATIFIAAGIMCFAVGGIVNNLMARGVIVENWWTENLLVIGAICEAILFSAGLASNVIAERKQKHRIQKRLIGQLRTNERLQQNVNKDLEEQVEFRTQKLKQQQEEIEQSLHEKNLLLQEIHHRVKNNLQMVYGMLGLQMKRTDDPKTEEKLLVTQGRIKAMALVHEELYQMRDLKELNLDEFIGKLINNLAMVYNAGARNVTIEISIFNIFVSIEEAVPIGLIVNEVVTNSFKHAFKEHEAGLIFVKGRKEDGLIYLSMGDDGLVEKDFGDFFQRSKSLGTLLIRDLSEQLNANLEIDSTEGLEFLLKIPVR